MNYEIKISRTEKPIPVIEDIHLHSIYNPEREAESFVLSNEELLRSKNKFLILGLGFGYHLKIIQSFLERIYGNNYEVLVVEPLQRVLHDFERLKPVVLSDRFKIISHKNAADIYKSESVIEFLLDSPGIIAHPASFNLHKEYFREVLSYQSGNTQKDLIKSIKNENVKQYLEQYCDQTWAELVHEINLAPKFRASQDFLMLALSSLEGLPTAPIGGIENE